MSRRRLNPEAEAASARAKMHRKPRFRLPWVALPYCVYALIFVVVPMVLVVVYSFFYHYENGGSFSFTWEFFARFFNFSDPVYMQVLWRSVWIALVSTLICLVIGYPMAYILSRMKPRIRGIVSFLFVLPMWMNFLLRTYAWMTILENTGILNTALQAIGLTDKPIQFMYSTGSVIFGNVYNFLPFMILPIYNTLIKLDGSMVEASGDLGASFGQTFRRVIFPLSLPGVSSGIMMTFMPALTTFIVSRLLGGSKISLIGDTIEKQFLSTGDYGFGSALSVILMVLTLLAMAVMGKYEKEQSATGGLLM